MESQNQDQEKLPKPELDLPLPEKEIPARTDSASQGVPLRGYGGKFPFPKYIFLGIVFVFLLLIVGGAYFLGRNSVFKELNPFQPVPPPAAPVIQTSPTPASNAANADLTTNWKTYIDSGNGIEFKYPNNWTAKKAKFWTFSVFLESHPFEFPEATEFSTSIYVGFNEFENTVTNKLYYSETTLADGEERIKKLFEPSTVKTEKMKIDGKDAIQISGEHIPGPLQGSDPSFTLVQLDNKLLIVTVNKDSINIGNQILSTFKFTDSTPTPTKKSGAVFCPQDAKKCPDGSYVSREGPNCEFEKCPTQ